MGSVVHRRRQWQGLPLQQVLSAFLSVPKHWQGWEVPISLLPHPPSQQPTWGSLFFPGQQLHLVETMMWLQTKPVIELQSYSGIGDLLDGSAGDAAFLAFKLKSGIE